MTAPAPRRSPHLTRRRFLALGATAAAVGALAACTPTPAWVSPTGAAVDRTERGRGGTGRVVTATLTAAAATLDLAGTPASTFSYGSIPGPEAPRVSWRPVQLAPAVAVTSSRA